MMTRFLAVILTVALIPLAVLASPPCGTTYHAQTYQQTYHAPTYQHQTYYPPHYYGVAISPDYYYSTSSYYAQKLQAEATAAETVKLLADAIRLGQAFQPQQPGVAPIIAPPAVQFMPQAPKLDAKIGTAVNPAFAALVAARCLKCHSGADAKGGVDLTNLAITPKAVRRKATSLACLGEMPPQGPELVAEEVALFKQWLKDAQ